MQRFWLQALIIIAAGLVTGLGFSLTTKLPRDAKIIDNSGKPAALPVAPTGPTGVTGGQPSPTGASGHTGSTGSTGTTGTTTAPDADADLISIAAAKALFDGKNAVFIDARPKAEFLQSHIVGAMQLEKMDLDGVPPAKVVNYLPGLEIVVYCHGELCTDSANLVKRLIALNKGIGPMHIIKEGFPGWQKAGHPVESGPEAGFQ